MTHLQKDFLWGNSVSSMQTEGAWDKDGKGKSVYDIRTAGENRSDWQVAIDEYHRYAEDFDFMKDLGMNCYRFQISWSRVQPDGEGAFNEAGIAYYNRFIDELIKRGIEPMVCLYHFDMPLALAEKYDGFLDRHVVDCFEKYGIEMVKRFGAKVKYWLTFNEQNLYHMPGAFRIGGVLSQKETLTGIYQISHHVMMAHTKVAHYIHEKTEDLVGGMLAYAEVYPAAPKPEDIFYARQIDEFFNFNLLDAFTGKGYSSEVMQFVKNHKIDMKILPGDLDEIKQQFSDFLPFSYYRSTTISSEAIPEGTPVNEYLQTGRQDNPYLTTTEWNWQIDPLGFRDILAKMYNRYHIPIFPIENGIGVIEEWNGENEIQDDYRIQYHREHIQAMKEAIFEDGVEVIGYLGWGLIDILSSQGDMRKRYGVVYVNRTNEELRDLKRVPKKSYHWFKKLIESNGEKM